MKIQNYMNKLVKYIRLSCYGLVILLVSCIRDGIEECPGPSMYSSHIKFIYDYNMSFEDLFHKQVSGLHLYLFDENDVFLHKVVEKCPTGTTFSKGHTVGVLKEFSEATQFVVYAGFDEEYGSQTNMIPGESNLDDLKIFLHEKEDDMLNKAIPPLWHGNICNRTRSTSIIPNDTTTISLIKNTNTIRVVLQSLVENTKLNIDEFSIELKTVNGACDAFNHVCNDKLWNYRPYLKENHPDGIAVAELSTMRLLSDRENRLLLKHIPSNKVILDVNLNKYLNALKLAEYSEMSLDEYLDREDQYRVIVFLIPTEPQQPEEEQTWTAAFLSVNEWVQRGQEGEVL